MSPSTSETRSAFTAAAVTALAMIAYQVAAKATRDAFFLSNYPGRLLPAMMVASSLLAVGLAYVATRALTRWGPDRVIPAAFAASAALLLLEWGVSFLAPKLAAVLLYLHYGGLGALLISGFWSFVNERFDPRTAKQALGRIAAAGTVGGLLGGILATQVGRLLPVPAMIPFLALAHLVAALSITRLRPGAFGTRWLRPWAAAPDGPGPGAANPFEPHAGAAAALAPSPSERSGIRAIASTPYIRGLITLVLLVTISEGLIDLVLKWRATAAVGTEGNLLQFFAVFYTGTSLLTVLVQAVASRIALEKLGPARSAALLPAGVAVSATAAIAAPGLTSTMIARGTESALSNSLYRGGYELLFNPVPAREKRAIKSLADVGTSRLGDILAAGIAQAVLVIGMPRQGTALLTGAIVLSILAVVVAYRLHAGYVSTLARGLLSRAVQLEITDVQDATTRSTVLQTLGPLALSQIFARPEELVQATPRPALGARSAEAHAEAIASAREDTAELLRIRDLHSHDPGRVRHAIEEGALPSSLVPHVIPLLGWDDVAREAIAALRRAGPEGAEPLVASLLDTETEFAIRRRIPLVLATYRDRRAVGGLRRGLEDRRFEVRYRCGRGLAHLLDLDPNLSISREEAFDAVLREVATGAGVWESRRLIDRMDDEAWSPVMDEILRDRANRSLEHIFTLLALVLPRQPLRIAFKGLHTEDPLLRGTALEYLESSLPPEIRKPLWPYLEDQRRRHAGPPRPAEQVLQDLLQSSDSIVIRLEELKRKDERS